MAFDGYRFTCYMEDDAIEKYEVPRNLLDEIVRTISDFDFVFKVRSVVCKCLRD